MVTDSDVIETEPKTLMEDNPTKLSTDTRLAGIAVWNLYINIMYQE